MSIEGIGNRPTSARTPTGNFGSVGGAEAVREDALAEVALGGGVGVLIDGAGGLVRAILAVAGVAVAKEVLKRRSDSDFPERTIVTKIVTKSR